MPTFIDMSALTKRTTLTGNEEFQVSATEKVTAQQVADLFKAMQAKLTGFAPQATGVTSVTAASTVLQAFQNIYRIIGNGGVKIITNAAAYNGFVCWSGSTCYGIVFNIVDNVIHSRNGFTQDPPTALTDQQWIDAIVNGGVKIPMGGTTSSPIFIADFSIFNEQMSVTPKAGMIVPFVTGSDVLSAPGSEPGYVGYIQFDSSFSTTRQATVVAFGDILSGGVTGNVYVGQLQYDKQVIDWMANKMAPGTVSAFTEAVLTQMIYVSKPGEFVPFTAPVATKSTANQYPENGGWNGFVTLGFGGGVHIMAFESTADGSTGKVYTGWCIGSTTQWTALGGGGTAEPIVVADAESVGTVVAAAFPKFEYGKMLPIYIDPGSDIYDYIFITAPHITVEESTVCGYAQCVCDGGDYYYIGVDLLVYPGDGLVPLYRAQMVINNRGDVADSSTFPLGMSTAPIPGYTKVNGGYIDCSLVNGSTTVVSLIQSVPANTTCFIEADVQTSVTGRTVKTSSALMFFRLASGSTMCDINSRALGGTNQGQVKLNVATIISQTSFVIVTTAYNLASDVSGGIIRIKNIYAKL